MLVQYNTLAGCLRLLLARKPMHFLAFSTVKSTSFRHRANLATRLLPFAYKVSQLFFFSRKPFVPFIMYVVSRLCTKKQFFCMNVCVCVWVGHVGLIMCPPLSF